MSGGNFDYVQYRIEEAARELDKLIVRQAPGSAEHDCTVEHDYNPEVIELFNETSHNLFRTAEMLQRVDWLVSGDDGPESFLERWEKDVRKPWKAKP